MTVQQVAEAMFYAAQSAYSYRGHPIIGWEAASRGERAGFVAAAKLLAEMREAAPEKMAKALIEPLKDAVPGGITKPWAKMGGMSRHNLYFIAEAFRKATADEGGMTAEQWDAIHAQPTDAVTPKRNPARPATSRKRKA